MALSDLEIRIRAFVEGLDEVSKFGKQLRDTSDGATTLSSAGDYASAGLGKLQASIQQTSTGVSTLTTYLKTAVLAFIAYAGVQGLKETADYAARTETLGVVLGIVAKNAGYSTAEIKDYEGQLKKSGITTQAAREAMTAMIQAGIPLGPQLNSSGKAAAGAASNVALLSRAAQDLAVVTGQNSSETFKKLITNIQQMDSMGLRFMGLTVDIAAAQEKWAIANNTTSGSLTQQQKIMAVTAAAMTEAAKLAGSYEASMDTVGKKVQSLTRYQEELRNAMGDRLLPAYGILIDAATAFTKSLGAIATATDLSGTASKQFADDITGLVNRIVDFATGVAQFISDNIALFSSISHNIIGLGSDILELGLVFGRAGTEGGVFKAALFLIGLAVAGVRDGVKFLTAGVLEFVGVAVSTAGMVVQGWGEIFSLIPGLKQFGSQLVTMGTSMREAGDAALKTGQNTVTAFANGQTATQDFINGVNRADTALSNFGKASTVKQLTDEIALLAKAQETASLSSGDLSKAQDLVKKDLVELSHDTKISAESIVDMANKASAAGVAIPEGFSKVSDVLKKSKDYAAEVATAIASIGKGTTFPKITAEITTLVAAQRNGQVTSTEAKIAYDVLTKSIDAFAAANPKATKEVATLHQQLGPVMAKIGAQYDEALKLLGKTTAELATGVSAASEKIAGGLIGIASNAETTALVFKSAFADGLGTAKTIIDVTRLSDSFVELRIQGEKLKAIGQIDLGESKIRAAAEAATLATAHFEELWSKVGEGSIKSSADVERLGAAITKFANQTGKSFDWVNQKFAELGQAADKAGKDIDNAALDAAFKKVGISAEEAQGKSSKALDSLVLGLNNLAVNAKVTGDAWYAAFSHGIDISKTQADLAALTTSLDVALKSGKISYEQFASGLSEASQKLNKLFDTKILAANTAEDFRKVGAEIRAAFEKGSISAADYDRQMINLKEKTDGLKASSKLLSEQLTALGEAGNKVHQAEAESLKAINSLQEAKNGLMQAELADRKGSTEITRAEVVLAKAKVVLATEEAKLKALIVAQEKAGMEVLIAMQKLLTAEKLLSLNADDEAAKSVVATAKDMLASAESQFEASKQAVSAQRDIVTSASEAVDKASQLVSNLKAAAVSSQQVAGGLSSAAYYAAVLNDLMGKFTTAGLNAAEALRTATRYAGEMAEAVRHGAYWTYPKIWEDTNNSIQSAKRAMVEANATAADLKAKFAGITSAISTAYGPLKEVSWYMYGWESAAEVVAAAYREISKEAIASADAARGAATSFSNSAKSIYLELLDAQGKGDEADKIRFQQRKDDLALEYELLKVKLQVARAQLLVAGLDTAPIDAAISKSAKDFAEAMINLDRLQAISDQKASDAKAKALADAKGKPTTSGDPLGNGANDPLYQKFLNSLQSGIPSQNERSPSTNGGSTSGGRTVYQVILKSDRGPGVLLNGEGSEQDFLSMLGNAKATT